MLSATLLVLVLVIVIETSVVAESVAFAEAVLNRQLLTLRIRTSKTVGDEAREHEHE